MNHALAIELHIRFIKKEAQIATALYRDSYPETLEDTGFTPIGLDEPYRIVVLNNPLIYTDPTGHWNWVCDAAVGAVVGAVVAGAQSDWDGDTMLKGAGIGAVAGVVGGAVGSYVGGSLAGAGYSATVSSVVGGAAGGAAAGATASALYGGNVWQGAMYGAIGGAAFGAIGAYYGDSYWGLDRVVVQGLAGGGVSKLTGGDFEQGAFLALSVAVARYLYNGVVNYDTTWESGGEAVEKDPLQYPVKGANNIGTQGGKLNSDGVFNEGGHVSRFANHIPGINAVGGLHDVFQITIDRYLGNLARNFLNIPGMIPAAAITYGGLMTDARAASLYYMDAVINQRR